MSGKAFLEVEICPEGFLGCAKGRRHQVGSSSRSSGQAALEHRKLNAGSRFHPSWGFTMERREGLVSFCSRVTRLKLGAQGFLAPPLLLSPVCTHLPYLGIY